MAESFGAVPFSIGGTNASGYSLVSVFTLSTRTTMSYSISTSAYDFGIIMSGAFGNRPYNIPIFFISSTGNTYLPYFSSSTAITMGDVYIQVSSTAIASVHTTPGDHQESIALFKFN